MEPLPLRFFPVSLGGLFCLGYVLQGSFSGYLPNNLFWMGFWECLFLGLAFFPKGISWEVRRRGRYVGFGALAYIAISFFWGREGLDLSQLVLNKIPLPQSFLEWPLKFRTVIEDLVLKSELPLQLQSVVVSLVLGSTKNLDPRLQLLGRDTGILHLFAASGLHLGVFLWFTSFLFRPMALWFPRLPTFCSLVCGFLYLYSLGFPISFCRAYLFFLYSQMSLVCYQRIFPSDTICYAGFLILILFPNDWGSPGFCLSFSAVTGIFFLKPQLESLFPILKSKFWGETISLSFACSVSTFPALAFFFHSYSFGGILINCFAVPFSGLLLPSVYFSLLVSQFPLAVVPELSWTLTDTLLRILLRALFEMEEILPWTIHWKKTPAVVYLFLFGSLGLVFAPLGKKPKKFFVIGKGLVLLLLFPILFFLVSKNKPEVPFLSFRQKGNWVLAQNQTLSFLGNCYAKDRLEKWLKKTWACQDVQRMQIESESCLRYALSCLRHSRYKDSIEFRVSEQKLDQWKHWIPKKREWKLEKGFSFDIEDGKFLRYDGNPRQRLDVLEILQRNPRGTLVLDFPPWVQDTAQDWRQMQKILGISSDWKILSFEEAFASISSNTIRD